MSWAVAVSRVASDASSRRAETRVLRISVGASSQTPRKSAPEDIAIFAGSIDVFHVDDLFFVD